MDLNYGSQYIGRSKENIVDESISKTTKKSSKKSSKLNYGSQYIGRSKENIVDESISKTTKKSSTSQPKSSPAPAPATSPADRKPKANIVYSDPTPTSTGLVYSGTLSLSRKQGESFSDYERRVKRQAGELSKSEARRLARENPGKEINVKIDTPLRPGGFKPNEPLYLRIEDEGLQDEVLRKSSKGKGFERTGYTIDATAFEEQIEKNVKERERRRKESRAPVPSTPEDPSEKFFGDRAKGKETKVIDTGVKPFRREQPETKFNFTTNFLYSQARSRQRIMYGEDLTRQEFAKDWQRNRGQTGIGQLQMLGERVESTARKFPGRFEESIRGQERFGAQQIKSTLSVTPGLTMFVRDREVTEKETKLYGGIGRGFVKLGSAIGVEAGRSLQDPIKDIALFAAGGVAGRVAGGVSKAFKPISESVSRFTASKGLMTRSIIRGTGKGLKGAAVLGVGGAVASDVASSPDPTQRLVSVGKEFSLVGAGFRGAYSSNLKSAESYLFKRKVDTGLSTSLSGSPGWSVKGDVGVLRTGNKKVFGIQKEGTMVFQTQRPQTTLSGSFITDVDLKSKALFFKSPLGLPKGVTGKPTPLGKGAGITTVPGFRTQLQTETGQFALRSYGIKKQGFESVRVSLQDVKTGKLLETTPKGYADLLAGDPARYRLLAAEDVFKFKPATFATSKTGVQKRLNVNPETGSVKLFATDPITAMFLNRGGMGAPSVNLGIERVTTKSATAPAATFLSSPKPSKASFSFAPSVLINKEVEDKIDFGITRTSIDENVFTSAKAKLDTKVSDRKLSATAFIPLSGQDQISGVSSKSRSKSRSDVRVDTRLKVSPRIDSVVSPDVSFAPAVKSYRTPSFGSGRSFSPSPRFGGFDLPKRDRSVFSDRSVMRPKGDFFGALKTASPGRGFIIAPGRKGPGDVRTIRLGGEVKRDTKRKKKEFWWQV